MERIVRSANLIVRERERGGGGGVKLKLKGEREKKRKTVANKKNFSHTQQHKKGETKRRGLNR